MKNPWETGEVFYGVRVAAQCVEDRKRMVATMDKDRLVAALNYPGTQKAVQSTIRARLKRLEGGRPLPPAGGVKP